MQDNVAETFLKSQGKTVPPRPAPVRPVLRSPKTVRVLPHVPKVEQKSVPVSTESVLTRQTQAQETTVRALSSTNELLDEHAKINRETSELLQDLIRQIGESKTEERYQQLLGSVQEALGAMQQLLITHADSVLNGLRESGDRHSSQAESLRQKFEKLQSHHDVLSKNLLGSIDDLQSAHKALRASLETRLQSFQNSVENLKADLTDKMQGVSAVHTTSNNEVKAQLKTLQAAQEKQHEAQLKALASISDMITVRMQAFSDLIDKKLANLSDSFDGVSKQVQKNRVNTAICSNCKNSVVKFSTSDTGQILCLNCQPKRAA